MDNQDLAKEYYINHSSCWIKPLWTYEAEINSADVILYYYSANIEKFQWKYLRSDSGFYNNMQWKNFIVWDTYQKKFLKQHCPEASYQVVGSIDFVDGPEIFKADPLKFTIAVFDVTPTRPVFHTSYGMAIAPYYSEALVIQFFNDIVEIIDPNDVELFWKQKRIINHTFITKGFVKKRDQIINKHIIAIDPGTPVRKLIERSNAVITIPFTSTAIIGKEYNKPSIYYDASGTIDKKEYHGIPLIKNKIDLQNWYYSLNI